MKNIIKVVALTAVLVTITITACNENKGNAIATSLSNNRLANTKWQCEIYDVVVIITFGQTSFTRDREGGVVAGTYRINNDSVIFTFGPGIEIKEALIGNELTYMGFKFRRIE